MARSLSISRTEVWRQRLARFQASRQTVVDFCRQEGVSQPSFYLWRKRLAATSSTPRRGAQAKPPAGFRSVHLLPAANISVQLPGGTQLAVPMADRDSLRWVIETVAQLDAAWAGGDGPC
jgi:hypothetical protein